MLLRRTAATFTTVAVSLALVAGCTSDGDGDDREDATGGVTLPFRVPDTVPPERLTPFCQGMIELADRLETDPPPDVAAAIVDTYAELLAVVPAELEADFRAVLAALRGGEDGGPTATAPAPASRPPGSAPATDVTGSAVVDADPLPDEGFVPADDPAVRISEYVDLVCRDAANNPGPPPTQPLDDIVPDQSVAPG